MRKRMYIDVRELPETMGAFKKLQNFMLGLHGDVALSSYKQGHLVNPWNTAPTGFTSPLLFQTSRHYADQRFYPRSKRAMANLLMNEFLPAAGYTLRKFEEVKPQAFWISVKQLKKVAFHVFTFRGGGIGVSVGSIYGSMGMNNDVNETITLNVAKANVAALRMSALEKLTPEERKALNL